MWVLKIYIVSYVLFHFFNHPTLLNYTQVGLYPVQPRRTETALTWKAGRFSSLEDYGAWCQGLKLQAPHKPQQLPSSGRDPESLS